MAIRSGQVARSRRPGGIRTMLPRLARAPRDVLVLLAVIWVALPMVPAETGLRFGLGFQVFFTVAVVLGALFFWFLGQERIPQPGSALGVFASVAGVYLATVGFLVAIGLAAPQFSLPQVTEAGADPGAARRGQTLFSKPEVGCFLCHSVGGRGGTRGPDLTKVAERAGDRVPGLTAEQYLAEKIKAGSTFQFKVAEYVPIMPTFGPILSEEQLADVVTYLLTLK